MSNGQSTSGENWTLIHAFTDAAGERIGCGLEDCGLGNYRTGEETIVEDGRKRTISQASPACPTCVFKGPLADVINPDEERFVDGAPHAFMVGAARVLVSTEPDSPLMRALRVSRPATAAMISDLARTETPQE